MKLRAEKQNLNKTKASFLKKIKMTSGKTDRGKREDTDY